MVEYFEEIGFKIIERNEHRIKYKDLTGKEFQYDIIKIFPFESARKRMGIIVQNSNSKTEFEFFVKGADDVMREKIKGDDIKITIDEKTFELASEGLRTLCFAKKTLYKEEYEKFENNFN